MEEKFLGFSLDMLVIVEFSFSEIDKELLFLVVLFVVIFFFMVEELGFE